MMARLSPPIWVMLQFGVRAPQQARVQIPGCGPCPAEAADAEINVTASAIAAVTRLNKKGFNIIQVYDLVLLLRCWGDRNDFMMFWWRRTIPSFGYEIEKLQ